MKRPLFVAAAAWMLGELIAEHMEEKIAVFLALLFFISCVTVAKGGKQFLIAGIFCIAGGITGVERMQELLEIYGQYDSITEGETYLLTGTVSTITESTYGSKVLLKVSGAATEDGTQLPDSIFVQLIFSETPSLKSGYRIFVEAEKTDFQLCRNEGNFDERAYDYSLKIASKAKVQTYSIVDQDSHRLTRLFSDVKEKLCDNIDRMCGEDEAGVLKAVLYADKADLDDTHKNLFRKNGIAHILAVSGLHMSIIGMGIYRLLRKKLSFVPAGTAGTVVICAFGMMTGFGISVKRALCMMLLRILADITGRTFDIKSAIGLSILVILADNPYAIHNGAFLLSYSAMLSIGIVYPAMEKWLLCHASKKEKKSLKKWQFHVLSAVLIWLVNLPVIAWIYFELPTYAILLNSIVIPLMSVLFCSGLAASVLMCVFRPAAVFVSGAAVYVVRLYTWLCRQTEKLPAAYQTVGRPSVGRMFCFYGILAVLLVLLHFVQGTVKKKFTFLGITFVLLAGVIYLPQTRSTLQISVIDVGQGDCTLVRTVNDHTYLIDGGSSSVSNVAKYRIVPYLKYEGIGKLDVVFVSHGDEDHIGGIEEMLREDEFQIGTILIGKCEKFNDSYEELRTLAEESGVTVAYVQRGDVLNDGELQFTVLNPSGEDYNDTNDASIVFYLTWQNFSMCFTGDISETTEQTLLPYLTTADVLKTAHHGSKYSSCAEFLAKVHPVAATISCQKNNSYGHPHAETLERLTESGARIFNTAELGRIAIEVQKNGGFSASGYLQQENES